MGLKTRSVLTSVKDSKSFWQFNLVNGSQTCVYTLNNFIVFLGPFLNYLTNVRCLSHSLFSKKRNAEGCSRYNSALPASNPIHKIRVTLVTTRPPYAFINVTHTYFLYNTEIFALISNLFVLLFKVFFKS